jgi:hypothetical protein
MKRLILILLILFASDRVGCPPCKTLFIEKANPIEPYLELFRAVCIVESSNNPRAYNKRERATGIIQIRPIRLRDYNKRTGKHYKLSQMYDISISKEIFMYYCMKFHTGEYEKISKSWNGKGKSNKLYWKKVKEKLELSNN